MFSNTARPRIVAERAFSALSMIPPDRWYLVMTRDEDLLAEAFAPPATLTAALAAYSDAIHPWRDGCSAERVLAATDALLAGRLGVLRRKPPGAWLRNLQIRRHTGYWRPG